MARERHTERVWNASAGAIPLVFLAFAFTCAAVILTALQPGHTNREIEPLDPETSRIAYAPLAALPPPVPLGERLQESLSVEEDVAHLAREVVTRLALTEPTDTRFDVLISQLAISLEQGQSDLYIQMLLTTSSELGRFPVPLGLRTANGRFDVQTLLGALSATAVQPVEPALGNGPSQYEVGETDSLAGLAMRLYGRPLDFDQIFGPETGVDPALRHLSPGQILTLAGI